MGLRLPATAPELLGEGVLLAPWEERDLPSIVELADEVARTWSGSLHAVRNVHDARRWLATRSGPGRIDWAVRDPRTRSLVGRTALRGFDEHPPAAEIGYGVHPAHRGRGVATAAVGTAVRYAFGELGLRRLELVHDIGNVASCAVAARSGFALEGVERSAMGYPDGRVADQHRHARLSTDPPGPAAASAWLDSATLARLVAGGGQGD
jgi:RimJ/RimL family protein N-acetyltransferase